MNTKILLLVTPLMSLPTLVIAADVTDGADATDDFAISLYGAAIHSNCTQGKGPSSKTCDFNNFNPGLGLGWNVLGDKDTGQLAIQAGAYLDSFNKTAGYGGFGYRKAWYITDKTFAGIGLQAGYLKGSGSDGFAALPTVMIGYQSLALEIGYASKLKSVVGRGHSAITTFSLRWSF